MTTVPVDQAPAGPALDAAVAEALGCPGYFSEYVVINGKRFDVFTWLPEGVIPEQPPMGYYAGWMPVSYSTDIAAAWELAEELCMQMGFDEDGKPFVKLVLKNKMTLIVHDYTAPLAITRAYLKAKGIEEVEIPD